MNERIDKALALVVYQLEHSIILLHHVFLFSTDRENFWAAATMGFSSSKYDQSSMGSRSYYTATTNVCLCCDLLLVVSSDKHLGLMVH